MNEDDTFRILKRVTFDEACDIINKCGANAETYYQIIAKLEKAGWTEEEFYEYPRKINDNNN